MAKKIVPQECCLMCAGAGQIPAPAPPGDTFVPCPMCAPARPSKTKKGES